MGPVAAPLECRILPFVPGRRPTDEALHPGLGSSEAVAVILPGPEEDRAWLLYELSGDAPVRARVSLTGPDGSARPVPVPGWEDREVEPLAFAVAPDGGVALGPAVDGRRRVLELSPARDLPRDAFTFDQLFSQQLRVELRAQSDGGPVATAQASLLVCDLTRCGSLYQRLLDRLVVPDAERQGAAAAFHPWFPVLVIGADKAALYTRALVQDIAGDGQHLSDPGWLMRVGLYLEFLTFLGICEAVKDEAGDLLSPAERTAFEGSDVFADLRASIDPVAWREVWKLRRIQFPRVTNLLTKRKATLRFLHVHHEDLKHAIRLAGRNHHNAQETWQRVFRDAERAVLRNVAAAFPELESVSPPVRDFMLWHRKGRFELGRGVRLPGVVSALLADQDGLFGSACVQYRTSMNHVADWAKARGLMDHTGRDCVPRQVSLLEAHVNQPARVTVLQQRDGYGPELDVGAALPVSYQRPAAEVEGLISAIPILAVLAPPERQLLARAARPLTLGPTERLVVQGDAGGSLFVVAEGEVEVVLRRDDGSDLVVDTMGKGSVVGEMSLLTGEPRSATVRALEGAVVYEVSSEQYGPVLRAHPELVDRLAEVMATRLAERQVRLDALDADCAPRALARRIRNALGQR
jgi:CRP-like cAMP-binding protein